MAQAEAEVAGGARVRKRTLSDISDNATSQGRQRLPTSSCTIKSLTGLCDSSWVSSFLRSQPEVTFDEMDCSEWLRNSSSKGFGTGSNSALAYISFL